MTPNVVPSPARTVHQRYRQLLRAGFTPGEAASLIARADGLDHHAEGEEPTGSMWRWQEIARLEFLRFLVDSGRLQDLPDSSLYILPSSLRTDEVPPSSEAVMPESGGLNTSGYASLG
jgi:hypothetical protein